MNLSGFQIFANADKFTSTINRVVVGSIPTSLSKEKIVAQLVRALSRTCQFLL
jgi:hypothetical protein